MQTHDLQQGTPEWHAYRRNHFNASDAPAMMGISPYMTRDQLVHQLATGLTAEVDEATGRRFADGHRFEALARPLAAKIIGEAIYPVTGSSGKLSASFDGLTMDECAGFEHKSINQALRDAMRPGVKGNELPLPYRVQMEQQCLVSGAERVLFMASKWDDFDELLEERHCWYLPDLELRAQIVAGWDQLEKDVAAYTPVEVLDKAAPVGRSPDQLPALRAAVSGELVLESNIKEWETAALAYINDVRNHELKTDEDFANADAAARWCESSKTTLEGLKANLMGSTGDVNTVVGTIDRIAAELDKTRLAFTKQITARKAARKEELLVEFQTLMGDYLRSLNKRLGRDYMPQIQADFAGAIYGKKNFDSMRSALNTVLANSKIAANDAADRIQANLGTLELLAEGKAFLFNDLAQLVNKPSDDFTAVVKSRIAEHQAEQQRKEDEQRERIRAEEQAKAETAAREKLVAEQAEVERKRQADLQEQQKTAGAAGAAGATAPEAPLQPGPAAAALTHTQVVQQMPASVRQAMAPKPKAGPPTLLLGEITSRLGFNVTSAFLASLGYEATTVKASKLYHEADFSRICDAIKAHIDEVKELQPA